MSDVSKFNVLGRVINIKDAVVRNLLNNHINSLSDTVYLTELVILGDSFSQGYLAGGGYANPNMSQIIADELNLNLHNYGVNGAGYTISGNTFQSQATRAISDTSYDHNKVKYVIVIGGINDANLGDINGVETASKLLVETLGNHFTKAEIVLAPCWGGVALNYEKELFFRKICSVGYERVNVNMLYDNIKCLIGYYNFMGADNVHPTQEGYFILAKNIVSMLHGGYIPRGYDVTLTAGSGWNISNLACTRTEDSIHIYGFVTSTKVITADDMVFATLSPNSGCVGAGGYIECMATNFVSYPVRFEPGVSLKGYEQNGFVGIANDRGVTIPSGTSMAINFSLPILNY